MRFERGSFGEFFQPTPQNEELLAQRRHWLTVAPQTYAALLPDGIPLLDETLELARAEETLPAGFDSDHSSTRTLHNSVQSVPRHRCLELGAAWEPDFLLLALDSMGNIVLVGGCVCFPSSWSLAEKIGRPIDVIHGIVPGLNAAIGAQIQGFLKKLRPGACWLRANWGLSRSPELN